MSYIIIKSAGKTNSQQQSYSLQGTENLTLRDLIQHGEQGWILEEIIFSTELLTYLKKRI